jgi:hypothetical protein
MSTDRHVHGQCPRTNVLGQMSADNVLGQTKYEVKERPQYLIDNNVSNNNDDDHVLKCADKQSYLTDGLRKKLKV